MAKKEETEGRATEWTPFGEVKASDLLMENREEIDEEIIELVDVVEEPESRLSIDQFVPPEGAQPSLDLFSSEPWAGPFDSMEREGILAEERGIEGVSEEELLEGLELKAQEIEAVHPLSVPTKEAEGKEPVREEAPEDEVFEKLELEEILEKVEMLKPALEKEWPKEEGVAEEKKEEEPPRPLSAPRPSVGVDIFSKTEGKAGGLEKELSETGGGQRPMGFDEFQALLKKDLGLEAPEEAPREPFPGEKEVEYAAEDMDAKKQVTTKDLESLLEEVASLEAGAESGPEVGKEPEWKEQPLGEPSGLAEFEALLQKGVEPEPLIEEVLPPFSFEEEMKEEVLEEPIVAKPSSEEELPELEEEALPEALLEAMEEELEEEVLESGEIGGIEAPSERKIEEITELPVSTSAQAEEVGFRLEEFKEVVPPLGGGPVPISPLSEPVGETPVSSLGVASKQLQESIARGVQEMIGDFITKILPEMTQEILQLTTERIEKMVREIVPELAEKAIRQEIERIEKGEK